MTLTRRIILALTLIAGIAPAVAQVPSPVPALPDTERRTAYTIAASTCACAVNFALYGDSTDYANWLEVWLNGTRVNFNDATFGWTITSPSGSLGSIALPITNAVLTFNSTQTGTVQIVGARRPRRTSQFNEGVGVPTRNFNVVLSDLTAQNREVWDKINDVTGRVVVAPPGETLNILASALSRASTVLGFDAFGQIKLYSPASGVSSAASVNFVQNGTGAVSVSVDALLRGKVFIPEMYASAAISAPLGTAAASVPDATAAIQATVNALCAIPGGGTVQLGPGAYGDTGVVIGCNNVWIRGSGLNATTLVHKLTSPSSALVFTAGASELSNTGVMDLAIGSNDTVINKIAVNISDVSFFTMKNVNIAHYPVDGSLYRASGGTGNAIFVQGREHGVVQDVQAYAEQPLHISTNPNSSLSMDSWVFRDLVLVSNLSSQPGPYHVITIDSGVNIFNTTMDGNQNWIGGTDGLHWVDTTSTQPSLGLYISGVKSEQSETSGASGYAINIQHNTGLNSLKIDGITGGDRALVKLRKVNTATLNNVYFDPGTGTGTNTVGYDIDSTVASLTVSKARWTNVGGRATTASVAGQNILSIGPTPTGFSATVPSDVEYTTATPTKTFTNVAVTAGIGVGATVSPSTGVFFSASPPPALTGGNQGAAGSTAASGLVLNGDGSTYDVEIQNRGDAHVCGVLPGTTTWSCAGLQLVLGSDATGDLYYRNSSGVLARLGIGSTGNFLNVAGGLPAWASFGTGLATPITQPINANGGVATVVTQTPTIADGSGASLTLTVAQEGFQVGPFVHQLVTVTYPTTASSANAQLNGLAVTIPNRASAAQCFISSSNVGFNMAVTAIQNSKNVYFSNIGNINHLTNVNLTGATITFECIYPAT